MPNPDQCNILQLNDDCFYHIIKFLPIMDWCSLRETCSRLRIIAEYSFERQAETFRLTSYNFSVLEVKRLLQNFGQFIKKLSINQDNFGGQENCGELVPYLGYCRSLVDLKFVNVSATLTTIVHCGTLFSHLQKLTVDQWKDDKAFACCLADCVSLKELELIRLSNIPGGSLAYGRMKSLESFSMNCCNDFNYGTLKKFLAKNWQLRKIKLFCLKFRHEHEADLIIEYIVNTLPKLEALSLNFNILFMPNIVPVSRAWLKKLEINVMYVSDVIMNQLLTNLTVQNSIEELHLALFRCNDELIERLESLKSLKVLKFTETNELDGNICRRLATKLPALTEVHIVECNDTAFNEIKEFVAHLSLLKRIIYNRVDDLLPSLTQEIFLSLIEARKMQASREGLLIFLNDDDLSEIRNEFQWNGMSEILLRYANVIRLLPLEKEHRRTLFEYGRRFVRPTIL